MNIKENIVGIEKPLQCGDVENNEDQLQIEDFKINIKEEIELYEESIIFTRQIYNVKDKSNAHTRDNIPMQLLR